MQPAPFPVSRPRRLRGSRVLRELVREHELSRRDLVAPLFVKEGIGEAAPIASMPGHAQHTLESLRKEAAELAGLGIPALLLFGIPAAKDAEGSQAWAPDGIIQRALRALAADLGDDVVLIADLCLCEYTDHGHCGIVEGQTIANDPTLELLAKTAVSQAEAGADVVAPSDMMDGRVAAIRAALDQAGHADVAILSYAAKYASAFYGPFREAAQSTPKFGDRRTHQMDPGNAREALREVLLDLDEGADMVMVKPALPYLDVLRRVREAVRVPVGAYHVSGEYAMIEAAAKNGWIDRDRVILESLTAIRRAGADFVLTYHAKDAARLLRS
jgi:porphobilinogen synthase